MRILFIGGTGEISSACVADAVRAGHEVTLFNRGIRGNNAETEVRSIVGDISDAASYAQLGTMTFEVVCQFLAFEPTDVQRDIELFAGRCGQYIFVSSASAYEKPCRSHVITEDVPLDNPYMSYSQNKAACEVVLSIAAAAGTLPVTIVRPSHTYRERLPSTLVDGDHLVWRMLNGKGVVVHGDGESLWTLTRSEDFARAFTALMGNSAALGQIYHVTDSQAYTWNVIISNIAELVGVQPAICHVASTRLVAYERLWRGPLLGDKSNSMTFDNTKVAQLTGGWHCEIPLEEGLALALKSTRNRLAQGYQPEPKLDLLIDKIIEEQMVV